MGVITISRGSYSNGKEIAEKLALNLGYKCISRDILLEASDQFNIPEVKLIRAIHDAPGVFERFARGKEKYIIFIRESLLKHFQKDNVVYHGLAGHFFIKDIPNILKVRIIAKIEDRVKEEMKREKIDEQAARRLLIKDDEQRRKWSMRLYGIDTKDPTLYDTVFHIHNLQVNDAVDILTGIARRPCFQTTSESQRMINDYYLAAKAQKALFCKVPSVQVKCVNAVIYINLETALVLEEKLIAKIRRILKEINGIRDVKVNVIPYCN